jgi:ribosomal protein L11 methyltransferase
VHILLLRTSPSARDSLIAELWERGTLGIEEREPPDGVVELDAYFEEPFALAEVPGAVEWREPAAHDWSVDWREAWSPIEVGRKLFLVPFWSEAETPAGRLRVPVFPGRASGSGASAPTQLALEAMEGHLRPGMRVADIGTGTGILAQAAVALGAGSVVACDIDAEAASIAQANFLQTGAAAAVWAGSARSLAVDSMDLIVANLNSVQLTLQAREFRRVLKPGGILIAGGFPGRHEQRVLGALGGSVVAMLGNDEWRCAVLRRSGDNG